MKMRWTILSILLTPVLVTGCSNAREAMGLGRVTPDEFAVVDRPPLAIPPDFSLKPPQPGANRPQEIDMTSRAEQIVVAGSVQADGAAATGSLPQASGADQALLQLAGAGKADPSIRATIDREAQDQVISNRRFIDHLLWWRKDRALPATVVDAEAEQQRLKDNQQQGKEPTEGATPVIEKNKSGMLGL